jgi:uncharacterized protein (TIRG00374 family)
MRLEWNLKAGAASVLPPTTPGTRTTLRRIQLLAGLAISAIALYVVLHDVEWQQVSSRIRQADYAQLFLAASLLLGTFMIKAVRWRFLLQRPPGLGLWHLFGSLNVAYFLNNLLPLQVGDVGRAYLASEIGRLSMTRTLSTIVVERVLDVMTLLAVLLGLALFIDIPSEVRTPSIILAVLFGSLALGLIFISLRRVWALSLASTLLRFAPERSRPKLHTMAASAIDGFSVISQPRHALRLFAYSVVLWLGVGLVVYMGIGAFDLELGYGTALFIVVATTFGFFVPSTPGSFGVYHAIVTAVLVRVFGVDKNVAVSFALIMHLVFYLPPMFLGPLFLWTERAVWHQTTFLDKLRELRGVSSVEPVA